MLTLATLMREGASLGDPLVVSTAGSWAWALSEALDRSCRQSLDRLTALRWGEADAAALVKDIQDQLTEVEAVQATLEELQRWALDAGRRQGAAQAADRLATVQQQAAEARRLLQKMIEARQRLGERTQRLQARVQCIPDISLSTSVQEGGRGVGTGGRPAVRPPSCG